MAKTIVVKPLGLVLRKAGLVSSEHIEKALKESLLLPKCKIGEILAIRGLIKPQTADFFAEIWPEILRTRKLQPIGQYLKAASLINEQQVNQILKIQSYSSSKFGKIAVEQGLISQATLDFFLEHLNLIRTGEIINVYPEALALELDRIENYLVHNQKCEAIKLLQRYDKIRRQGTIIAQGDLIEKELIASGIAILERDLIKIAKANYLTVFNESWVEKELANLQPYNKIRLKMFNLDRKAEIPYKILSAVNKWTEHQPDLTQKLYQLIQEQAIYITPGEEEIVVEELIYKHIIDNWKAGAAAKHFQTISDRIMNNEYCSARVLLTSYKKIWQLKEINLDDSSIEQRELLDIGLIKLKNNRISVSNLIYQAVFNLQWIEAICNSLVPELEDTNSTQLVAAKIPVLAQNSLIKTKSPKNIFNILVILISLMTIPFFFQLLEKESQNNQSIEQENSFFRKINSRSLMDSSEI
jgi:hypothetical protein